MAGKLNGLGSSFVPLSCHKAAFKNWSKPAKPEMGLPGKPKYQACPNLPNTNGLPGFIATL